MQRRKFLRSAGIGVEVYPEAKKLGKQLQYADRRGFRVAIVGSTPYPGVTAGVVLRQNPQAGFQIGPDEAIGIEVSR